MKVVPIAQTFFNWKAAQEHAGYVPHPPPFHPTQIDELAEFAGRLCYQSWSRPNPATANNDGYLRNIIDQGHFSVMEHASVSFYVEGVSRALLTELERHRHLSFSVISQRYVPMSEDVAMPPALEDHKDLSLFAESSVDYGWTIKQEFNAAVEAAFHAYTLIANKLVEKGIPRKKALEAARSVLPNATEVKMVVTGNLRAWRDVLEKRYHVAADAEIQNFATEVLKHLRVIAPNSFQDFPGDPYRESPRQTVKRLQEEIDQIRDQVNEK